MQKTVHISVFNDLKNDQRVLKTIQVLQDEGYLIKVQGLYMQRKVKLKPIELSLFKLRVNKGFLRYAFFNIRLFFKLLFTKADIFWANDMDTLAPNFIVSKLRGKKLIFDSHEIFSELPELQHKKIVKKVWQSLEWLLIPRVKHCITVSNAYAQWFEKTYNREFKILRNAPIIKNDFTDLSPEIFTNIPKDKPFIIYQGAINHGRGIDKIIAAMPYIDAHLILVGKGDLYEEWRKLPKKFKVEKKVHFLGRMTPEQLKSITPKADLGISIEEKISLSYYFALPNKIFDYIHAGIPILSSNFPEMKSIVKHYNIGDTISNHQPKEIALKVNMLLKMDKNKFIPNLQKAKENLNWNREKQTIIDVLNEN